MSLRTDDELLRSRPRSPLARALVHLPETSQAELFVRFAVELAQRCGAHLRGMTLVDTGNLEELVATCEGAAYSVGELERLQSGTNRRNAIRARFSEACLQAGLDFDLQLRQGNSLHFLAQEARFHDLLMTATGPDSSYLSGEWSPAALVQLVLHTASPVLAWKKRNHPIRRVLLIQDGTPASSIAIRSFLAQGLFPPMSCRLLAVSPDEREGQQILRESVDYVRSRVSNLETGFVWGHSVTVVPAYIRQWEADLVVLGAQRRSRMLRLLFGETVEKVLRTTNCALYSNH